MSERPEIRQELTSELFNEPGLTAEEIESERRTSDSMVDSLVNIGYIPKHNASEVKEKLFPLWLGLCVDYSNDEFSTVENLGSAMLECVTLPGISSSPVVEMLVNIKLHEGTDVTFIVVKTVLS